MRHQKFPQFSRTLLVVIVVLLALASCAAAAQGIGGPVTCIAVQMQVSPADYQSEETFAALVDRYMQSASTHFRPGHNIVAFPEDVGLGLVFLGHCDEVVQSLPSIWLAAGYIAENFYGPQVMAVLMEHPELSFQRALLLVRGEEIERVYREVFSEAARKYDVTLVAGSAPIPGPDLTVYNTCYVFGPEGDLLGVQRKVHLIDLEQAVGLDLTSGSLDQIKAIRTPAGLLGVAICYDAFFDDVVDRLVSQGARILVQPSFNPGVWDEWQAEDWLRGMWTAVGDHSSLVAGINPMMVGNLWEIGVQGISSIVGRDSSSSPSGYLAQASSPTSEDVLSTTLFVPGYR